MNEINFSTYHLDFHTAKNPCRSVDAATKKLISDAGGVDALKPHVIDQLVRRARRAIDLYNPGDPRYAARTLARIAPTKRGRGVISVSGHPSSRKPAGR